MLNFSKYASIGFGFNKVCYKCTSETSMFMASLKKCLKPNKADVFRINQVRSQSNLPPPPPPGLGPSNRVPSFGGIPYVNPNQGRSPTRYIMIWIPIISFGLGTWQVKRLKWKTELINNINRLKDMDPVPLPLNPAEVAQMEFHKVTVKGVFDHDNELFYGPKPCFIDGEPAQNVISKDGQGSYGYNLITPFIVSGTGERILVNRGWIATKTLKKEKRPWSVTEGEQSLTGIVRNAEPTGILAPTGDPKFNIWHFRDLESMCKAKKCLPIYIDLTDEHSIPNCLWAGQTILKIRNEHLSYAITWYALSIATYFMWYARYKRR